MLVSNKSNAWSTSPRTASRAARVAGEETLEQGQAMLPGVLQALAKAAKLVPAPFRRTPARTHREQHDDHGFP